MNKIVTLGEIMMRLSPPDHQRFLQTNSYQVNYGGGEANVAVSLAQFGLSVEYITKVPNNPIGEGAVQHLRKNGVIVDNIARGGERLGIYFLENGASIRGSQVVYDRAHAAITDALPEEFDFDKIFHNASWFHISGITPALGSKTLALTMEALEAAKKYGVTISLDVNYRGKLWSMEEAHAVIHQFIPYVDVLIGNEVDGVAILGLNEPYKELKELLGRDEIIQRMQQEFNFKYIVTTRRQNISASDNEYSAQLYDGHQFYYAPNYHLHIVDRVGGGDAFAAGLIYGLSTGMGPMDALNFATAAGALKHTISGDVNYVTIDEVNRLVEGNVAGSVQR